MADRSRRLSPRPAIAHTWRLLGSKYSLSIWVVVFFAVPSLVSSVLLIDGEGQGQWWQYLLFCLVTWMAPVLFLLAARAIWAPLRVAESNPVLTVVVFLATGAFRGLVIYVFEPMFGLVSWSNPITRLISETITIAAALAIIAVVISARRTYQDSLTRLASDREELLELQLGAAEAFNAQRDSLVEEARGILNPILESLRGLLSTARDAQALEAISVTMRQTIDDVIRPLSASLAHRSPNIQRSGRTVPSAGVRLVDTDIRVRVGQFILPFTFTAFMFLMSTGALIITLGPARATQAAEILVVSLFVSLWIFRLALSKLRLSARLATLSFVLTHALSGSVFIAIVRVLDFPIALSMLLGWLLVVVGVAYLLMRYQLVEWVRGDVITGQAAVNAELEIAL